MKRAVLLVWESEYGNDLTPYILLLTDSKGYALALFCHLFWGYVCAIVSMVASGLVVRDPGVVAIIVMVLHAVSR